MKVIWVLNCTINRHRNQALFHTTQTNTTVRAESLLLSTPKPKTVHLLSDGTGATVEKTLDAVMGGFDQSLIHVVRHFELHGAGRFETALKTIIDNPGMVLFTLDPANRDRAEILTEACVRLGVPVVSCISSESAAMATYLGRSPIPHSQRPVEENSHNVRLLAALKFAREFDDGQGINDGFKSAHIVLVAPSRTGKTPISMGLAVNHQLKAMNIPFVANITSADQIATLRQQNPSALVVAITRNISELGARRRHRTRQLHNLNGKPVSEFNEEQRTRWQRMEETYFGERFIVAEARAFERFCNQAGIADVLDITRMPSEEVVSEIKARYDAYVANLKTPAAL